MKKTDILIPTRLLGSAAPPSWLCVRLPTLITLVMLVIFSVNTFAEQVPFADVPFDTANIPEPVPPPAAVRDFFQLDPYYQQWINVRGYPVLASAEVSPYAVKEVAWTIGHMIGHRPDILRVMAENKARFSIVPHNKHLSDIPEYDAGRLTFFWDTRARGVGGRITSSPEENIICGDPNYCYAEVIHEFAHQVHDYGLGNWGIQGVDPTFDSRLETLYNMAIAEGLYQHRYAGSNRMEYWAEGVGSWFNGPNKGSNVAPTRVALKAYDPRLAKLLTEVHGDGDWRYTPPATRTHLPHLQGFNPEEAPIYQRPARLLELERQLRDPDSDGDGKWVNLKLHDPSELPHLLNTAPRNTNNSTQFLFVNLTGTDISLYFFTSDGTKRLQQRSTTPDVLAVYTWVGAIWLLQDHTGKDIAVFRAVEQVGRVLIGGPPSRETLDVNSDGIVDLLDLIPIASRYGHREVNPADVNKDGVVNIVDVLLVAGNVSALPRQVVETFNAAEVQKWLSDANQLGTENEYQQKGIGVLEHLLTEIESPSKFTEVATDPLKAICEGHTAVVFSVAFSPDGQTLASGSWDKTIRLWNLRTRQLETILIGHTEDIVSVTFSPDRETLASAGWDSTIRLWNPQSGKLKRTLVAHSSGVASVAFSPDGQTLASGSADRTIHLWDTNTWQVKRTLTEHTDVVDVVAFSPDGQMLASGSRDKTIRLWNPDNGEHIRTLTGHIGPVNILVFSPDGQVLVSGSWDRTTRLWNPNTGQHKRTIPETGGRTPVVFSPDDATLLIGGHGISIYNTETGEYKTPLTRNASGVSSLALSPDGQTVATGSEDSKVRLWEFHKDGETTEPSQLKADVTGDGIVNVQDLVWVASNFGQSGPNDADVNEDGIVNIVDLVLVAGALGDTAAAPTISAASTELFTAQEVQQWLIAAKLSGDNSPVYRRGILMLEQLLMVLIPKETALLPNYPNPFNPETWIPYQLAKPADVTLHIYAADGALVRTLALGYQVAGIYKRRNRAAYWDGKNELGEKVASGLYFYTLFANDFTATRKMLIMK